MKNELTFTELEKAVMSDIICDGFFYDDLDNTFVGYAGDGFGKQERGALASLVKKGVISILKLGRDSYVYLTKDYTKADIIKLFDIVD